MSNGYAYRLRQSNGQRLVQLKSLAQNKDFVHRRTEVWANADQPLVPQSWAPSPARDLVLRIIRNQALEVLFEIHQIRHQAKLLHDGVVVAELSLDEVVWQFRITEIREWELEIEFLGEVDSPLIQCIDDQWVQSGQLVPQTTSKFERGLATLQTLPHAHP